MKLSVSDPQTLENVARGKFHQNLTPNFTTPLAEKNGENFHSALLHGSCSESVSQRCPRIACYGFWCLINSMCDTPPCKRGIQAILVRDHMKTRKNGCDTPSAMLSRKVLHDMGGISHCRSVCLFSEAAPTPSLFRGVRQLVWNHLESVSCHFCGQGFWSSVE